MLKKLLSYFKLAGAYWLFNLRSQLEYRGAFISQSAAMFLNNGVWLAFWMLYFSRFPCVSGFGPKDIVTLWGICAGGFGLAHSLFGNALFLPSLVVRGQLDVWMLYPRALLPHLLLGRMSASAVGDAVFGFVVYLVFVQPDLLHFTLFTLLTISVALFFVGFSVASGSLAFYLGNAEALAEQWRFALITFSTYPFGLFEGKVKLVLYTVIPAAFISYYPVEALKKLSIVDALIALAGSVALILIGAASFYGGLKRYESGNLMEMRG